MELSSGKIIKTLGFTLTLGIFSEICYQSYLWLKKKNTSINSNDSDSVAVSKLKSNVSDECVVLFFPDLKVACKSHFIGDGCGKLDCRFSHEANSLSRLYQYLSKTRKSLDVCVFVITCSELADVLIEAHKKGVIVRVITDDQQVDVPNSQIWKLRSEGIIVRTDKSSFFMHHKFVVVDKTFLMNGSFNWTRQAITGNQENMMVTYTSSLVEQYIAEFEKLWDQFNPKNYVP